MTQTGETIVIISRLLYLGYLISYAQNCELKE